MFQPTPSPTAPPGDAGPKVVQLDLLELFKNSPIAVQVTIVILLLAAMAVWIIAVLKYVQIARIRGRTLRFEREARRAANGAELYELAGPARDAAGGRVLFEIYSRGPTSSLERLRAIADRAIVEERQRARWMLTPLSSIASASPFVGLFGTVYGILDTFFNMKGGVSIEKIAPKIGEALITTAIGLAAAIPAVVLYNSIEKRVSDFIAELEAAAGEWVTLIAAGDGEARAAAPRPHTVPRTFAQPR